MPNQSCMIQSLFVEIVQATDTEGFFNVVKNVIGQLFYYLHIVPLIYVFCIVVS